MRQRKPFFRGIIILCLLLPLFCFPLDANAGDIPVTSAFGWRVHPIYGDVRFHSGLDLGYAYGTPVPAMLDGTVVAVGDFQDGYGNQIVIYHQAWDAYTRYAHLSGIDVTVGMGVPQGYPIGYVGATGNATGPHLHLEWIVDTENGYEYADPMVLFE